MPQYLIFKLEGDDPRAAKLTAVVFSEDEPDKAVKQGFTDEGRYAIVNWDQRVEADLGQGPVKVSAVQDQSAREGQAAEAEEVK